MLDQLSKQPGVQYTITESPDTLRQIDIENISSLAHRELQQHRELREITRIAAWEMPLLSQLAKPFQPPTETEVLRWRYTTYLGEAHPAARKVVVEFQPSKLPDLNSAQREKLLKLAGARYNPSTGVVKMACESFETQAQNKRYLADTVTRLLSEARDLESDSFADVPLDTRHHKAQVKPKFPKAWLMTPERRKALDEGRKARLLEEGRRVEGDGVVSGVQALKEAMGRNVEKVEAPVMANARQGMPTGKMGKKEMGQKGRR